MMRTIAGRAFLAIFLFYPFAANAANGAELYVKAELAYANQSNSQRLDLYTPIHATGPFPVVIWIHGGNFYKGDKASMPFADRGVVPGKLNEEPFQIQVPDVTALVQKGYAVVSLNYRLGGSNRMSAALNAVHDGKAAIRYLRANAGVLRLDPTRFAVWGNSAGGFVAAMLGVTGDQPTAFDDANGTTVSSEVQVVIVWFGVAEIFPPPLQFAPYIASAKALPPFLIVNGDADTIVTPEQAGQVYNELVRGGASSTLTLVKGAGHEDPLFMETQMQPAFAFLKRYFAR